MSKRILFFTDIHFGLSNDNPNYMKVCVDTMKWIKQLCHDYCIDTVVFGGDFFDNRIEVNSATIDTAIPLMHEIADDVSKTFVLVGNHDMYLKNSTSVTSLRVFGGNEHITVVNEPLKFEKMLLLPYTFGTPSVPVDNELLCDAKYVFCHHEFTKEFFMGSSSGKGKSDSSDDSIYAAYGFQKGLVDSIVANNGYIFSGHIHKREEIPLSQKSSLIIAGSPYETSHGFSAPCGTYVIDCENDTVEFVENPYNVHHIEVHTSSFDSYDISQIKNAIVRLYVDSYIDQIGVARIQHIIREQNPFVIQKTEYLTHQKLLGNTTVTADELNNTKIAQVSKLDYLMKFIDNTDFSTFKINVNGVMKVIDKNKLKQLVEKFYEVSK